MVCIFEFEIFNLISQFKFALSVFMKFTFGYILMPWLRLGVKKKQNKFKTSDKAKSVRSSGLQEINRNRRKGSVRPFSAVLHAVLRARARRSRSRRHAALLHAHCGLVLRSRQQLPMFHSFFAFKGIYSPSSTSLLLKLLSGISLHINEQDSRSKWRFCV